MPRFFKNLFDLTDRVALVTGGTGGLGSEVALALSDFGAKVTIVARKKDSLDKVATEISNKTGNEVNTIQCDVAQESEVKDLVKQMTEKYGRIDILANFAGRQLQRAAAEYSLDDWNAIMLANVTAVFLTCREVGKVMIKQNKGKIINPSSVRGEYATIRNNLGYCATKASVNMITRQLACEWAKFNILVNAIAPSVVETPLTQHVFKDPAYATAIKARIPLGRWGQPEDIAGLAVFLASDASNFITGQIIYVDGGVTTW